jgi:hypothetical protein
MFRDHMCPSTEEGFHGPYDLSPDLWMSLQDLPLTLRGTPRLVQDIRRNTKLAYVMQHCCPTQLLSIRVRQSQFLANYLCERAHSLAVATRRPVMSAEAGQQQENGRGNSGIIGCVLSNTSGARSSLEFFRRVSLQRKTKAARRLARENK